MTSVGNIRDTDAFMASLPAWTMLDGCFGRGIKPTDIDGCVEVKRRCLFLEHKRPSARVQGGQKHLFDALIWQGNTVIVFWSASADATDMTHMQLLSPWRRDPDRCAASLADLRKKAARWFWMADAERCDVCEAPGATPFLAMRWVEQGVAWQCAKCGPFDGAEVLKPATGPGQEEGWTG